MKLASLPSYERRTTPRIATKAGTTLAFRTVSVKDHDNLWYFKNILGDLAWTGTDHVESFYLHFSTVADATEARRRCRFHLGF